MNENPNCGPDLSTTTAYPHRNSRIAQRRSHRAFTLLELIVVLVVVGMLSLVAASSFSETVNRAADKKAEAQIAGIARQARSSARFELDPKLTESILTEVAADSSLTPQLSVEPSSGPNNIVMRSDGTIAGFAVLSESGRCALGYASSKKIVTWTDTLDPSLCRATTVSESEASAGVAAGGYTLAKTVEVINMNSANTATANAQGYQSEETTDGRYVVFSSSATDLVPGVSGARVYRRDRATGTTALVSATSAGANANGGAFWGYPSADGRYVAFQSSANNLVAGRVGSNDIFRKDMVTGNVVLVSVGADGNDSTANTPGTGQPQQISADGNLVAFVAADGLIPGDTNGFLDVLQRNIKTGTTILVSKRADGSQLNQDAKLYSMNEAGTKIAWGTADGSVVAGDTNGAEDIFIWSQGTITLGSATSTGAVPNGVSTVPQLSANGRYLVFESSATDVVAVDTNGRSDVFWRDLQTPNSTKKISFTSTGTELTWHAKSPSVSSDGRYATYVTYHAVVPEDLNGIQDGYIVDTQTLAVRRASFRVDGSEIPAGSQSPGTNSLRVMRNGKQVMFKSPYLRGAGGDDIFTMGNPLIP